ncbi:MAG: hypothetical protein RLZZ220_939 [Pseudomonadota bacterium]|nr:hypothetical protein [Azonexus sp.]HRF30195.1 hypothetical protein [Azonexus sp.]
MPSPILARADALMHRKRQSDTDFDDVPVLTDAIDDDDDIPLLLEIDEQQQESVLQPAPLETQSDIAPQANDDVSIELPLADIPPLAARPLDSELREQLAGELARRIEQRITAELPRLIDSALRDFLAEQEMIAASTLRD